MGSQPSGFPPVPGQPSKPIECALVIPKPPYELTASLTAEQFEAIHAHYVAAAIAYGTSQADDGFNRGFDQARVMTERVEEGA
jgi:hypothetical protein